MSETRIWIIRTKCKDVKNSNTYHKKPGCNGNTITPSSGMIHSP
jgi:hypothetical protein